MSMVDVMEWLCPESMLISLITAVPICMYLYTKFNVDFIWDDLALVSNFYRISSNYNVTVCLIDFIKCHFHGAHGHFYSYGESTAMAMLPARTWVRVPLRISGVFLL